MDSLDEPFWDLDQVAVWAITHSEEWVRRAREPKNILLLEALFDEDGSSSQRELEEDLWQKSGWDRERRRESLRLQQDSAEGRELRRIVHLAKPEQIYSFGFPVSDYLTSLFRSGKLHASGIWRDETRPRPISQDEWVHFRIRTRCDLRAKSFRREIWRDSNPPCHHIITTGGEPVYPLSFGALHSGQIVKARAIPTRAVTPPIENVRVAKGGVLRFFDAAPTRDLESILRAGLVETQGKLTQDEGKKIAAEAGIIASERKIIDTLKKLKGVEGKEKTGPKGPRKNCRS